MISTIIFYILASAALISSLAADKTKTRRALQKAWKSFVNIAPSFVGVILLVGIMLAFLSPEFITSVIGEGSGAAGVVLASIVGAVTLIPGFIAFPTAALLLQSGAGLTPIAAFISSLMMVGVMTLPIEIEYFGIRASISRNIAAYLFSLAAAFIIGAVLS